MSINNLDPNLRSSHCCNQYREKYSYMPQLVSLKLKANNRNNNNINNINNYNNNNNNNNNMLQEPEGDTNIPIDAISASSLHENYVVSSLHENYASVMTNTNSNINNYRHSGNIHDNDAKNIKKVMDTA